VVTLAIEPVDDLALRGAVNFVVLSEDGLRRLLAGADFRDVSITGGSPVQFDPVGNLVEAVVRAPGLGNLTVIVYNESTRPASYTLTVNGGVLVDDSGQTLTTDPAQENPAEEAADATTAMDQPVTDQPGEEIAVTTAAPAVEADAPASAEAQEAETAVEVATTEEAPAATPSVATGPVSALRLSGSLNRRYDRHYLVLEPSIRDADITLTLSYDPMDRPELIGNLNFLVLTEDGVRRMVQGESPKDLNLATGFPTNGGPINVLNANFRAAGSGPYSVVVFNDSATPATYVLEVTGALLVDGYGQTNEAVAAAAEIAAGGTPALQSTETDGEPAAESAVTEAASAELAIVEPTDAESVAVETAPEETTTDVVPVSTVTEKNAGETPQEPGRVTQVSGDLTQPYEHDYLALIPDTMDSRIIVTLAYEPKFARELEGNLNFWVLNEDGLRQVIDGARPIDHNLATGEIVRFGPNFGALEAVFTASGMGTYTIIAFNNSTLPATYTLSVQGGFLEDNSGKTQILASLP
jgi:hypothetical protein